VVRIGRRRIPPQRAVERTARALNEPPPYPEGDKPHHHEYDDRDYAQHENEDHLHRPPRLSRTSRPIRRRTPDNGTAKNSTTDRSPQPRPGPEIISGLDRG